MRSIELARFRDFQLGPTASLLEIFRRLAIQEGWKKSKSYKERKRMFLAEAVEARFLDKYGVNDTNLQAWQNLCQTIGVPASKEEEDVPLLTSIWACEWVYYLFAPFGILLMSPSIQALTGACINLVDLVDAGTAGTVISKKFGSSKQPTKYIIKTGNVLV